MTLKIYDRLCLTLTLDRFMSHSWAAFSFSPDQALKALASKARPKQNVSAHGLNPEGSLEEIALLIASKFTVASSSFCPPDKNPIPGSAVGTVLSRALT